MGGHGGKEISANAGGLPPLTTSAARVPSQLLRATPEPLHPVANSAPLAGPRGIRPKWGIRSRVTATFPPRRTRGPVVGQVELAAPQVVAVELLLGDEGLDVVEGLVHLVVQAKTDRPVLLLEPGRPRLQLGDDHSAVTGAGPEPEWIPLDHHHGSAGARQLTGGGEAAVARPHDGDVDRCRQRVSLELGRVGLGLPQDPLLVGRGQAGDRAGHDQEGKRFPRTSLFSPPNRWQDGKLTTEYVV